MTKKRIIEIMKQNGIPGDEPFAENDFCLTPEIMEIAAKQIMAEYEKDVTVLSKANKTLSDALVKVEDLYAETLVPFYDQIVALVPDLKKKMPELDANVEIARKRGLALIVLNQLMSKKEKPNGRKPSKK